MSYKIILDTKILLSKSVYVGLTNVYGIGFSKSNYIIKKLGISKTYKVSELNNEQIDQIHKLVKKANILVNLELKYSKNIKV